MDYLNTLYPPLSLRLPLPTLYIPTALTLFALTPLIPGPTSRTFITLPPLLLLTASTPFYTTGSLGGDYNLAVTLLGLTLAYVDFFVWCPLLDREGEGVRFTGHLNAGKTDAGIGEEDCGSAWAKFVWAMRLLGSPRGIGWTVQVNGVPAHDLAHAARWVFVRKALLKAAVALARKLFVVYVMGFALMARDESWAGLAGWELEVVVGWAGAAWAWNGLEVLYFGAAGVSVAVGVLEPWEWPPLFGRLAEAWCVRQMWSSVWHQLLRRKVQEPGARLARLLNLRKGGLTSSLLQLTLAFTITLLMHEWHIFSALRRDIGEFHFFAVQPLAFIAEGIVQGLWRRYVRPYGSPKVMNFVGCCVGYVWTFAWFSYCLPGYVEALVGVGMIGEGFGEAVAMDLGRQTAFSLLD